MKFSLISDMHVNHPQPKTPYDQLEDIVVVAGDTSNGLEGLKFLQKLRNKGHVVIAVDGNHEHYSNLSQGRAQSQTADRFREEYPSIVDLGEDKPIFIIRNGWYFVEDEALWYHYMNDGRYACLGGEDVSKLAKEDAEFVSENLFKAYEQGRKAIVVTHTSPCIETLNKEYLDHYSNDWYWNSDMKNLLGTFKDTILVWCHGHTHAPADEVINGVRVVCNPRGYPGENPTWKPLTIEV